MYRNNFLIKRIAFFQGDPFKSFSDNFLQTWNEQNRKTVNVENPLNFYMKNQATYSQMTDFQPPPQVTSENLEVLDSEIPEKMEINNEFNAESKSVEDKPVQEEIPAEQKNEPKEEEKGDFMMENEIENTIFSKPIVSKMNANVLTSVESKPKEITNKVESPTMINEENEKKPSLTLESKSSSEEDAPQEESKDRKFERKAKRRMSRDDAGVEYNQNPLDYLFPKEREKHHQIDSPKKLAKECEDAKLKPEHQPHPRHPDLSKSFSHSQSGKNEEEEKENARGRNVLSSSVILENKKYKVVFKKVVNPGKIVVAN